VSEGRDLYTDKAGAARNREEREKPYSIFHASPKGPIFSIK